MAKKGKAKPKTVKPRLVKDKSFLPGLEEKKDPVLSKQCERLIEARAAITEARGEEKDIHDKLLELMDARGVKAYKHNGKIFQAENKVTVKFKNLKDQNGGINPGPAENDEGELDEPEPTGQSEVLDGVKELADEAK